jgi:CBS domain-containing protein
MTAKPTFSEAESAADYMLREPKTLAGGATVADVRVVLANPKVQMVLLADGSTFRGAITAVPETASAAEPALAYADPHPETIAAAESAKVAYERAAAAAHRRVIVLGDDGELLGLLCLNQARTHFCQTS